MRIFFTVLLSGVLVTLLAQQVIDFESIDIAQDTFNNGRDEADGFYLSPVFLRNDFDPALDAWTGWAISSKVDTVTPGFTNQYACIAGSGANESQNYTVSYAFDRVAIDIDSGFLVSSASFCNATYPFLSMLNGDAFSKKFGGIDGSDPDYFLLTIFGFKDGILKSDSVSFYLADFRSDDESSDYIVKDWTTVDLSILGRVDSLFFKLSSSDVGAFGMNTPAYFCMDNLIVEEDQATLTRNTIPDDLKVYPNPASEYLMVQLKTRGVVSIFDLEGRIISQKKSHTATSLFDISGLQSGMYFLEFVSGNEKGFLRFLKN